MKAEFFGDFKLKDIVLISSLPDMGRVGGLVTEHIAKKISAKDAAKITLVDKPWVNQTDGLVEIPSDEYKILVDEKNSLVIFTGENQPQEPDIVFDLVNFVVDTVQKWGKIKTIISTGGYMPMQKSDADAVYGVATSAGILEMLKSHGIKQLSNDVKSITWFNGLVLGAAKNRNIDGIGLFGEIYDVELPQHNAAKNIINKIEKILNLQINTDELVQKIAKPAETKKDSPGIG
ncbi:MAG: PAC2 family protein [Candidatus Nitrosotenuis sp.]